MGAALFNFTLHTPVELSSLFLLFKLTLILMLYDHRRVLLGCSLPDMFHQIPVAFIRASHDAIVTRLEQLLCLQRSPTYQVWPKEFPETLGREQPKNECLQ